MPLERPAKSTVTPYFKDDQLIPITLTRNKHLFE